MRASQTVGKRPEAQAAPLGQASRQSGAGWRAGLWRVPLLAAAILALLAAVWAGWIRIGWQWPVLQPGLVGAHGPLMISGFFGTLISVERAVALRRRWTYAGPVLSAAGAILLIAGMPGPIPRVLLFLGSLGLVAMFVVILRRHLARYTVVMAAGSVAWAVGNLLWSVGWPVQRVILWWAAFLILTIAGERLELGRLARYRAGVERLFTIAAGLFVAGLFLSIFLPSWGTRLASLGILGLGAWLVRYDIARRTVRQTGLPRFAAVSLLSGYGWLVLGGALGLRFGAVAGGFLYDAFLHSLFLGYVFAMIFAHAPIIFPAILGLPIVFRRSFYLPLFLLHFSLLLRIGGDLAALPLLRKWGGLLNGITILLFLALTAESILAGARRGKPPSGSAEAAQPDQSLESPVQSATRLRKLWAAALSCFILAGLTGSLMRLWMMTGFPGGIQLTNVRHAHSHMMYFAWVTPALMALITARLPSQTGRSTPRALSRVIGLVLLFGLLSYPPFFLWGYELVAIAGRRIPIAVIFSTLNILAWYAFMLVYRRATRGAPRSRPLKLWNAALVFLAAASLGAWGRAVLVALKIENPFISTAMVHLFLDLFSGGWGVLGLLGLVYASRPRLARTVSGWEDPLIYIGLPLTFLLGVPVELVPTDLRTLAGIGGLMAAAGLILHVRKLWPHLGKRFWDGWGAPLAFLLLYASLEAAASFTPLARWGELVGLRILYLHVLLMGAVSLGLFAAGQEMWRGLLSGNPARENRAAHLGVHWMAWAVLALLASLLPLTNIWPADLGGSWRLLLAFIVSFGPVLGGMMMLNSARVPVAKESVAQDSGIRRKIEERGVHSRPV